MTQRPGYATHLLELSDLATGRGGIAALHGQGHYSSHEDLEGFALGRQGAKKTGESEPVRKEGDACTCTLSPDP
jgi:hypothetical protein